MEEMDWEKCISRFLSIKDQYESLHGMEGVNVAFALLLVFAPLENRYRSGERTPELYQEMMEVQ